MIESSVNFSLNPHNSTTTDSNYSSAISSIKAALSWFSHHALSSAFVSKNACHKCKCVLEQELCISSCVDRAQTNQQAGTGSSASGVDQSINGQGPSFTNNLVENTEHALEANESSKFGPASAFDSQVSNAEAEDSSATSKQGSSALVPGVEATQESSSHGPSTEAGSTTSVVQATSVAQSTEDVPPPAQTQRRIPGTCPTPDFGAMTPTDAGLSSAFHAPTPMKDLQLDSPVEQQFSQASPRAQEFGPSTASPTSSNTVQANLARATHALSRQTLTRPAYLSGANKANSNTSHQQAANRILDGGSISPRACDQCVKKNHECIINEQKSTKCCWCTSTAYPCNAAGTK